jgi:hypothetical protein
MVEAYDTGCGAWLMYGLVQVLVNGWCMVWYRLWCMVDSQFGIGVGARLMHLLWYMLWYMIDVWYGIG